MNVIIVQRHLQQNLIIMTKHSLSMFYSEKNIFDENMMS